MTAVPAAIPLTTPDDDPTVAVPVALLVHTPPDVASVSVMVAPVHTAVGPLIADNELLTFTVASAVHPDDNV